MLPKPELEWDYNLGDIILGMPVIRDVCVSDRVRLVDRLPVIVTHGLCHLIGYRHGDSTQWNRVWSDYNKHAFWVLYLSLTAI